MEAWSDIEVELIVQDYFSMLSKELKGEKYVKAEHRRNLLPLLKGRSDGSIEFKHQNISAVLVNFGQPYIKGYLPRQNYQRVLEESVIDYLKRNPSIEILFSEFVNKDIGSPVKRADFSKFLVDPPKSSDELREPSPAYMRNPIKVNYLEKEQQNRNLGLLGEEYILDYEKWHLAAAGRDNLSDQVRWIAKEDGDGAGFDILSKNSNGTDKYIEVKTTRLGKETPFFFTRNELLFSKEKSKDYHLYRLFNFDEMSKMFRKNGGLDSICRYSEPTVYKGYA